MNVDKRHAFIKMINRRDAMSARDGMETYKSGDMQLRVRNLKYFVWSIRKDNLANFIFLLRSL